MIHLAVVHVPGTPPRKSGLQLIGKLSGTRKLKTHPRHVGVTGMLTRRRLMVRRPGSVGEGRLPLLLGVLMIHDLVGAAVPDGAPGRPPLFVEKAQEGQVRQRGCCQPAALPLVANNDGHKRGKLLESDQRLILDVSQPENRRSSCTSHGSKYEMGPSGDGE